MCYIVALAIGPTNVIAGAKTSRTITKVVCSNVYYYSASTGTSVLSKKDLSGYNMKTDKEKTIDMPRVNWSYPDYYKKCDLAK